MPIKIQNGLPARAILESENVFIMDEDRAESQDIRPLEILILNLMPTKVITEISCFGNFQTHRFRLRWNFYRLPAIPLSMWIQSIWNHSTRHLNR